jgi:hypothetical protein
MLGEGDKGDNALRALPVVKIVPATEFYDYEAKYFRDDTRYFCPSGLPPEKEAEMQALAKQAFTVLGCRGWGRVDVLLDQDGTPLPAGDQHRPGHDRPQPGAHGRPGGGHRISRPLPESAGAGPCGITRTPSTGSPG